MNICEGPDLISARLVKGLNMDDIGDGVMESFFLAMRHKDHVHKLTLL